MLHNRTIDRVLIVAVPVVLFVYASTRPILRLRADMPRDFVDTSAARAAQKRVEEHRIALAYWQCALTVIQWRHSYGSRLPPKPPADFRILVPGAPPEAASASRLRYWERLRQFWVTPDSWKSSREWNTHWLTDPITDAGNSLAAYVSNLVKMK